MMNFDEMVAYHLNCSYSTLQIDGLVAYLLQSSIIGGNMLDRARLLQKKLSIGNSTRVTLKSGLEYEGLLTEISMDHISLKGDDGCEVNIFIEDISATS
jgi:hypothetical protein